MATNCLSFNTHLPVSSALAFGVQIMDLTEILGGQTYKSLARKDETMTTAGTVTYACDQIDQARAALNAVSK